MKTSRNDPFELELCVRGLGNCLTWMYSDLYEYCYYLTFKRSMKEFRNEFNDAYDNVIDSNDFFLNSTDLLVRQCATAYLSMFNAKTELILRWGIDDQEDMDDLKINIQANRFQPFILVFKKQKSYKKMNAYAIRTLESILESLFKYACVFTAQSYKVPLVLRRRYKLSDKESLEFLNTEDSTVLLLTNLITTLRQNIADYKTLIVNKGKPAKVVRVKTAAG